MVGETASIICTSDLDANLIEWIHNYEVVLNSTNSELELIFNPVHDKLHGQDYTCRVSSPYGIQEDTIRIVTLSKFFVDNFWHTSYFGFLCVVPSGQLQVSTSTEGSLIAGEEYQLNCSATVPFGVKSQLALVWLDAEGIISSGEGIIVSEAVTIGNTTTRSLLFSPLRNVHEGRFVCQAKINTPSPPYSILNYAEIDIFGVDGMFLDVFKYYK